LKKMRASPDKISSPPRPMSSPLVLALDIGTSSTRTALFDDHAHRILPTTAQQKYRLHTTPDGGAELDPAVLLRAARHCLDQTMRVHRSDPALRRRPIAGIGVSSFWHSLLGVNAKGDPVTRVFTWADSRCRADAAALREKFGEKTLARAHGLHGPCIILAGETEVAATHAAESVGAGAAMDVSRGMAATQAHRRSALRARHGDRHGAVQSGDDAVGRALLKTCGLTRDRLRPLSDEPLPVAGSLAREFPELRGVPWFPGIGDGAASNLGSGATRPGLAAINFGTSGALRVIRESGVPRAPFGVSCYRVDARRYLVGGAVSNAGNLACVVFARIERG
jgi:gluconokinase